jgi:hypothetical protein
MLSAQRIEAAAGPIWVRVPKAFLLDMCMQCAMPTLLLMSAEHVEFSHDGLIQIPFLYHRYVRNLMHDVGLTVRWVAHPSRRPGPRRQGALFSAMTVGCSFRLEFICPHATQIIKDGTELEQGSISWPACIVTAHGPSQST